MQLRNGACASKTPKSRGLAVDQHILHAAAQPPNNHPSAPIRTSGFPESLPTVSVDSILNTSLPCWLYRPASVRRDTLNCSAQEELLPLKQNGRVWALKLAEHQHWRRSLVCTPALGRLLTAVSQHDPSAHVRAKSAGAMAMTTALHCVQHADHTQWKQRICRSNLSTPERRRPLRFHSRTASPVRIAVRWINTARDVSARIWRSLWQREQACDKHTRIRRSVWLVDRSIVAASKRQSFWGPVGS